MNIFIINVDSNPQFIGGIKRVCVSLAHQWILQGINVDFICIGDSNKRYNTVAGIPQTHLPNPTDVLSKANKVFLQQLIQEKHIDILFNPYIDCKDASQLCFDVHKNCDVILVCAWHFSPTHFTDIVDNSFFIRYKLGNPIQRYLVDSLLWIKWKFIKRKKVQRTWSLYFKECVKNSDAMVFLSSRYLPTVDQMLGYHSNKVIAINNPNSFAIKDSIEYSKKDRIVLWSGRLGYDMKRTDKMLSVWKQVSSKHKDWKLIICGSGNSEYFKELCIKYHIENVEFPGFVNMEEYYTKASILCNTSVTEGLPMILNESLTFGCIPITFDSYSSVHDIIKNEENGYIVPAFKENEYVQKLDLLMSDENLRLKMASNGHESINRFNPKDIAQQWVVLFKKLMSA